MMAKPVKTLELHYPMIQFLTIRVSVLSRVNLLLRLLPSDSDVKTAQPRDWSGLRFRKFVASKWRWVAILFHSYGMLHEVRSRHNSLSWLCLRLICRSFCIFPAIMWRSPQLRAFLARFEVISVTAFSCFPPKLGPSVKNLSRFVALQLAHHTRDVIFIYCAVVNYHA